jgi:hypothetical protein
MVFPTLLIFATLSPFVCPNRQTGNVGLLSVVVIFWVFESVGVVAGLVI